MTTLDTLGCSSFMIRPKWPHISRSLPREHKNEFEVKLKKIRSDNGKEFDNTNIEAYYDKVGIKHEVSATYTPQ